MIVFKNVKIGKVIAETMTVESLEELEKNDKITKRGHYWVPEFKRNGSLVPGHWRKKTPRKRFKHGIKSYWTNMTSTERSNEMKRRAAKRK